MNGSALPAARGVDDEEVAGVLGVVPVALVVVLCEPLDVCDEPDEPFEDAAEVVEGVDVDGVAAVVVPLSGSTYCWSPAEVVVPAPSAGAAIGNHAAPTATDRERIRKTRPTAGYSSSETRRAVARRPRPLQAGPP